SLVILTVLAAANLLTGAAVAQNSASHASGSRQAASYADQQIRIPRSAAAPRQSQPQPQQQPALVDVAVQVPTPQPSLVRQAAHGQIVEERPPAQLSRPSVRQASGTCDCGECSSG